MVKRKQNLQESSSSKKGRGLDPLFKCKYVSATAAHWKAPQEANLFLYIYANDIHLSRSCIDVITVEI